MTKVDRGGGKRNRRNWRELIYSRSNTENNGKEGKSESTWNRSCQMRWAGGSTRPKTVRAGGECVLIELVSHTSLEKTGPVLIFMPSYYLTFDGVGCCHGSIPCLPVLLVFGADLFVTQFTPQENSISLCSEPSGRWKLGSPDNCFVLVWGFLVFFFFNCQSFCKRSVFCSWASGSSKCLEHDAEASLNLH